MNPNSENNESASLECKSHAQEVPSALKWHESGCVCCSTCTRTKTHLTHYHILWQKTFVLTAALTLGPNPSVSLSLSLHKTVQSGRGPRHPLISPESLVTVERRCCQRWTGLGQTPLSAPRCIGDLFISRINAPVLWFYDSHLIWGSSSTGLRLGFQMQLETV